MAAISKSAAALRVSGDALDPTEITSLLGASPTRSWRKGDVKNSNAENQIVHKTGGWVFAAEDRAPGDLSAQLAEIVSQLTADAAVWALISDRYQVDLFCGLFMKCSDEGFSLPATSLADLAKRGIELQICLYAPAREVSSDDPCPCGSDTPYGRCCAQ
jgi:hypothetical protein